MRLPRQFNHPQAVPRELWLDPGLALAVDSIRHVLVVVPIRAVDAGILSDVELARLVVLLGGGVDLALRGERAPDARVLLAKIGIVRRLAGRADGSRFLGIVTVLAMRENKTPLATRISLLCPLLLAGSE